MFQLLIGKWLWNVLERMADSDESAKPSSSDPAVSSPAGEQPPSEDVPPSHFDTRQWSFPKVERRAMGSLFEIYLAGPDRDELVAAGEEALDQVERLESQLSHYRSDSDIARLNANAGEQWVRVEPRLYALLKNCLDWSKELDGAFDITSGPLVKAWGFYRGEGRVPTNEELAEVMERVGFYRILTDDDENLIRFSHPESEITLGAVGKGYAIDEAAETLSFWGVKNAVIHGGQSTIYAMGDGPESDGWEFVVRDPHDHETPLQTVVLKDESLSTSGNYEQYFEHEGVRYSHIIDPVTGKPTQGIISVSVVASSAAESDALSTAFFVLGRQATEEYCRNRPNIRVVIIEEAREGEIDVTRIGF